MKKRSKKTYSSDQVAVILEDIRDQFSAFGDGLNLLNKKVDELIERVDRLEARMDSIENRMNSIENRMNSIENRMNVLEIKVDDIASDIADIKRKLGGKVAWDDLRKLEKRVFKLEKIILLKS